MEKSLIFVLFFILEIVFVYGENKKKSKGSMPAAMFAQSSDFKVNLFLHF